MVEWLALVKYYCSEYQAHIFVVLCMSGVGIFALILMVKNALFKMSENYNELFSRQTMAEELNKLKFEFVGKGLQDVKDAVKDGKKDTDTKIQGIHKEMKDTRTHLEDKYKELLRGKKEKHTEEAVN